MGNQIFSSDYGSYNPDAVVRLELGTPLYPTTVDARTRTGMWVICEFKGNEKSSDDSRKCKHYDKSANRSCCMYYRDTLDAGVCDCQKE